MASAPRRLLVGHQYPGTRLYTANNFNNTVSVLDIKDPRRPTLIQTVTLKQDLRNASPNQIALRHAAGSCMSSPNWEPPGRVPRPTRSKS